MSDGQMLEKMAALEALMEAFASTPVGPHDVMVAQVITDALHGLACRNAGITEDALKGGECRWEVRHHGVYRNKSTAETLGWDYGATPIPVLVIPVQEKSE